MTYETLSVKAKQIYDRYQKGYVTDAQLERYYQLKAISEDEYNFILESKHPKVELEDNTEN